MSTGFIDEPFRAHRVLPVMERSGVTGKSPHQVSASRRDASVIDAMSCTTESSLRDSIIINHAYPTTPLRSMAGYFQHALTGSEWENMT